MSGASSSYTFLAVAAATAAAASTFRGSSLYSPIMVDAFAPPTQFSWAPHKSSTAQRTAHCQRVPYFLPTTCLEKGGARKRHARDRSSLPVHAISPFQEQYRDDDGLPEKKKSSKGKDKDQVEGTQAPSSSTPSLHDEILTKFKSLFEGIASIDSHADSTHEEAVATLAATALAKTKGGAGGRGGSSLVTLGSPSTTTVSFPDQSRAADVAAAALQSPCDSALPAAVAKSSSSSPSPSTSLSASDVALGKVPEPVNENIARISGKVPNTWLAVCHSSSLKKKELKKIWVDDKPICLFRAASGEVKAISDICLHRAAALSDGWLDGDLVVCPYHAYKFDGEGKLRYIPGVDEGMLAKNKRTARTVWYKTLEQGGLIYLFPDAMRAGAIEQHVKPFLIPEEVDPSFRVVEGVTEIKASANLVVENLLDMLHISYVHSFGNMQEPLPFSENYDYFFDDEASQLLPYARTTFKYRAGPTSISKVVGQVKEVVVENEFHLPYTTVTRVKFGKDVKTIYVVAVPVEDGLTVVHYKLYRNFMYVHPQDESPVNKGLDHFFQSVMRLTLNEDKEILESLYQEHQAGYVLSRYDKPLKIYRKALKEFMEASKSREFLAERRALEMELLRLIECTERGRKATRGQHSMILSIVQGLERGFARQFKDEEGGNGEVVIEDSAVNGTWHLVYANPGDLASLPPDDEQKEGEQQSLRMQDLRPALDATATAAGGPYPWRTMTPRQQQRVTREARERMQQPEEKGGSAHSLPAAEPASKPLPRSPRETDDVLLYSEEKSARLQERLRSAGGERYLLDFTPSKGRPLWVDTDESTQTIDTSKNLLSNTAVYQGLLGITTKVELNGIISTPAGGQKSKGDALGVEDGGRNKGHRQDVQFTSAKVDVGGFKVTFPHMDVFGVNGWLDTTFVDEHIRICRGNRGSIFVLTRRPLTVAAVGKGEV
ncbi:hypothetical protein NSK_001382 [Nannochloropsis salina CCMP1776]|uniref:Rieske domain-containing protein n=1 Tax=Nannochloropsis salina CCMP1776 TaxID=1027361 RepID=A0A4D9DEC4_9STRA|nr:hypothetical protein NSK_001382 [Nannochloropsis salina CCMP1776]|eukprot:TFJ87048.1 hypothetical protein NSK_001382 [Nannochloropsis salina CCMP1776]